MFFQSLISCISGEKRKNIKMKKYFQAEAKVRTCHAIALKSFEITSARNILQPSRSL